MLDGVKVFLQGQSAAAPFAARLMAQHGADVIWLEHVVGQDVARNGTGSAAEAERENMRNISLDVSSPAGKEIFKKIIAQVDIFIENSKAGQYKRWGLDDEVLWGINPKLVIAHVSGFGQAGDPRYEGRAAYDMVAQAFGGSIWANTFPGEEYQRIAPGMPGDYISGFTALFGCLAGYINAQKTGKGESFDIAQYECLLNTAWQPTLNEWVGMKPGYTHKYAAYAVGTGGHKCKDGNYIYLVIGGAGVMKGLLETIGMADEYGSENFPVGFNHKYLNEPGGPYLQERITQYLATKTVAEADAELSAAGVSCSPILSYTQMLDNPQYKARKSLRKITSRKGVEFLACAVLPKATNCPGRVFRPCPSIGEDSSDVLAELGYSEAEIRQLIDSKIVKQTKDY